MASKVLLVEDSLEICEAITDFFADRCGDEFVFEVVNDGSEAIEVVSNGALYDMVLLDIMLPGASGFEICVALRRRSDCPVIFLTALGTEDNILRGYNLGADDYMVKPFSLEQLYAKMKAILKRTAGSKIDRRIVLDEIELDPVGMRVYVNGDELETTAKEYFLLKVLLENKGQILTREQLLIRVWGRDFDGTDRVVDNHIKKLRKLLGSAGNHIVTAIGRGYRIV